MKRKWWILGVIFLSISGGCLIVSAETQRRIPIYSVETKEKVVAITFDSAWGSEDMDAVLGTLRDHNVKASFFMTGSFVTENPEIVKRLLLEGHDIGNHGDNHCQMTKLSQEECSREILGMHTKVKNLTGQDMWLFRPPYGDYNDTVIKAAEDNGYLSVQWNLDSVDWKDYGVKDIVSRICNHKDLKNGSIILLHTGTAYTAKALDELLSGLENQGYGFVPLSKLVIRQDYTIDHEGRQRADVAVRKN